MANKVTFTNASKEARNISLIGRSGSVVTIAGMSNSTPVTLDIPIESIEWYSQKEQKEFYQNQATKLGLSINVVEEEFDFSVLVVKHSDGDPINGATVKFGTKTKTTGATGIALFDDMPSGATADVTVEADGFVKVTLAAVSTELTKETIYRISLREEPVVEVFVTDTLGAAVEDATVKFGTIEKTSDATGKVVFDVFPETATANLVASKDNFEVTTFTGISAEIVNTTIYHMVLIPE